MVIKMGQLIMAFAILNYPTQSPTAPCNLKVLTLKNGYGQLKILLDRLTPLNQYFEVSLRQKPIPPRNLSYSML